MRPIIYIRPLIRSNGRAMGLAADVQRPRATAIHFCNLGDAFLLMRTPIEHLLCLYYI
ncbi:hypothetical protein Hanom_Chr17g01546721 [Helianthus anomalus]